MPCPEEERTTREAIGAQARLAPYSERCCRGKVRLRGRPGRAARRTRSRGPTRAYVEAAGSGFEHVVRCALTDVSQFAAMSVYKPARRRSAPT